MSLFPGQFTFDSIFRAYAVRDNLSLSEMIVSIGDIAGKINMILNGVRKTLLLGVENRESSTITSCQSNILRRYSTFKVAFR